MADSIKSLSRRYERWLRERYPRAFNPRRRPPLLLSSNNALKVDPERPTWATDKVIQDALARWVNHALYRRNVLAKRPRVDLQGRPTERVKYWEWLLSNLAEQERKRRRARTKDVESADQKA
jgi:sRNA-binding protein